MILKRKYRYVLILTSRDIDASAFSNSISNEIMRFMGELAYSEVNPRIVAQYTPRLFVIKINRSFEDRLILASSFVKQINGTKIGLYTLKTSGTIKSLMIYAKQVKD